VKFVAPAALILLVIAAGLTFAYRADYGNLPWDGGPDRLQWCDRRYYFSAPHERPGRDRPLKPIFKAPPLIGDQVYAERSTCGGNGTVLTLYRGVGDGEYAVYGLSGGP
jgi:hypothetical protein